MKKEENKPQVRFKGFTDDWEQRKVSDICTNMSAGGDVDKSKLVDNGKYPVIANALTNEGIVGYYNDEYRIKAPAVTVTGRGDVGHAKARKVDFTPVVRLLTLETEHDVDFLENAINTVSFVNESTGVPQLTVPQLSQYTLSVPPTLEEEKAIGEYLLSFDTLITLHQRKCDTLTKLKKAMLQKMFPQNNSKYPEIRFKGFTDAWEQRKVSEITNFHKQGFYTTEAYDKNKKYYLLRGTDLTENKLILKDTPKIDATEKDYQAFKTEVGDFLIVRSGTVGTYGIVYDDIPAIFGSYLIDFRFDKEQVVNEFFGYFYQSDAFKNQLRQIIQQSANTNINAENIKSTSIMLPTLREQEAIGNYFENLDTLITLHHRKCDTLKKLKKAMLQKMFI